MLSNVRKGITDETQETYQSVLSVVLNQPIFNKKTSVIAFHSF